jgi:hypothetical protein
MKRIGLLRNIAEYYVKNGIFAYEDLELFKDPTTLESAGKAMSDTELKLKLLELEIQKHEKKVIYQQREHFQSLLLRSEHCLGSFLHARTIGFLLIIIGMHTKPIYEMAFTSLSSP